MTDSEPSSRVSRRDFLKTGTIAAATGVSALTTSELSKEKDTPPQELKQL